MWRLRRPEVWRRVPGGKPGRAIGGVLVVMLLAGVLAAGVGSGYAITEPLLGDGSAYLAKGHSVVRVNGETGRPDAQVAQQLATGSEPLQTVRLPDGRIAVVNKATGAVSVIDAATMTPTGPTTKPPAPNPKIEALATTSDGYLVDPRDSTVELIGTPGKPAAEPITVPGGIVAAAPNENSVWVLTGKSAVVEVVAGHVARTIRLGEPAIGLTVADGHPVAVTASGQAFAVDAQQPRGLGDLGLTGPDVVLGSFRGAGRYVTGVDRHSGRFAALDPRTGRRVTVNLALPSAGAQLAAPVVLGSFAYVPDYSGPSLFRINLATGKADAKPLEVPGQPGAFALEVSGERVWANSQYDRRLLVVDAAGHERYADKGPGSDVVDSQAQNPGDGQSGGGPTNDPATAGGTPTTPPVTVTVPSLPKGATKDEACAAMQAARLRCRAVAVGSSARPTGEVVGTDPPGGTRVRERSVVTVRYVGPLKTPSLLGLDHAEACRAVTDGSRFTCAERVDPQPVTGPDQLGVVTAQDPKPGASLARGAQVRITFSTTIALPPLSGQTQGEACDRLTQYKMTCQTDQGDPGVGAGKTPGTVYAQNPPAGSVVTIGTTVRVVAYSGRGTVGAYQGANATDACAQAQASGFTCVGAEGRTAAGTGAQPGVVYDQSPAPGSTVDLGQQVTVTYYSGSNDLPSYTGVDKDQACADLAARAFQCNPVAQLFPSVNKVEQQDQPAGRYPLGSVITIRYSRWSPVKYKIYGNSAHTVWVLRQDGDVPDGYGEAAYDVGSAYPPGSDIPGGQNINGFYCTVGNGQCNGIDTNHFYSKVTSYADPNWHGPTPRAVFMPCELNLGYRVYRTWNAGMPRYYNITRDPPAGLETELLGCVW